MIPKKIYWCWFGKKELSALNKRCMESWKKYCPDYEIIKVSEENFDVNKNPVAKEAYEKGNFAVVSDVARFEVIKNGGFYCDTDLELFGSLDFFRDNNCVLTAVQAGFWNTALIGAEEGDLPEVYKVTIDALLNKKIVVTHTLTNYCNEKYNLLGEDYKQVDGIGFYGEKFVASPRSKITESTVAIHHEENTWTKGWILDGSGQLPFVPFMIYREGDLDNTTTRKWFSDLAIKSAIKSGSRVDVSKDRVIDTEFLGRSNLFYNPKVVSLQGKDYCFRRRCKTKTEKHSLSNEQILEYEEL